MMEKPLYPFELRVFVRKPGLDLRITSGRLILFISVLIGADVILNKLNLAVLPDWFLLVLVALWILSLIFGFFEQETTHLTANGTAVFYEDGIVVNNKRYSWQDISELKSGNVYKENIFDFRNLSGPKYASGKDAFISIKNGSRYHLWFESYSQQIQFEKMMKAQYTSQNLALNLVSDGLKMDYEAIQQLKRTR